MYRFLVHPWCRYQHEALFSVIASAFTLNSSWSRQQDWWVDLRGRYFRQLGSFPVRVEHRDHLTAQFSEKRSLAFYELNGGKQRCPLSSERKLTPPRRFAAGPEYSRRVAGPESPRCFCVYVEAYSHNPAAQALGFSFFTRLWLYKNLCSVWDAKKSKSYQPYLNGYRA